MKKLRIHSKFIFFAAAVFMLSALLMPAAVFAGPKITINPNTLKQLFKKNLQLKPGALNVPPLFTFNVPVNIQKVHKDVEKAYVLCVVSDSEMPLLPIGAVHAGYGGTEVPLNNGAYNGTVTVRITSMDKGDPAGVSYWGCFLVFQIKNVPVPLYTLLSANSPYGPAPGTNNNIAVEGTLFP